MLRDLGKENESEELRLYIKEQLGRKNRYYAYSTKLEDFEEFERSYLY